MVPQRLSADARRALRAACLGGALTFPACRKGGEAAPPPAAEGGTASRIAATVKAKYTAPDVEAAGAWVWTSHDSLNYVMVDAQSAVQGIIQGRAELWLANEQVAELYGRSEVLPSAAEFGAYDFQDLTGDNVPDFFGYVSDSSGVSYPVFFAGSRPGMTEEIALAATGWRFDTDEEHLPRTYASGTRPCALQLWALSPAPDNGPEGWRWLMLQSDGRLGTPTATAPTCPL